VLVTNQAILDAVIGCAPKTVLDIGCGEGWLVRKLEESGIDAMGIDAVPELIEHARKAGKGRYEVLSYENLSGVELGEKFDVAVGNFSLLGEESVNHLFRRIPSLLHRGGALIVQTLHPITGCGDEEYVDGWREGSWKGFGENFRDPAPWYFRTIDTWKSLFEDNGFTLREIREPGIPQTQSAVSIIFISEHGG
jgi:cyclopropane fatty-acyl-phospholipid synthase-like methyltransferase